MRLFTVLRVILIWFGVIEPKKTETSLATPLVELEAEVEMPQDPTVAHVAAVVVDAAITMCKDAEEGKLNRITVTVQACDELVPQITPTEVLHEIQDETRDWENATHGNSIVPRVMDVTLQGSIIVGTFEEGVDSE